MRETHSKNGICYISGSEYNGMYNQFLNTAPRSVKIYLETNWHPTKEKWVMRFKFSTGNFYECYEQLVRESVWEIEACN